MKLRKTLIAIVALLIIFSSIKALPFNVSAKPDLPVHNVDTGMDYETIQNAINANETLDGHIIQVDAGTYYEHVVVNKSIALVGENKFNTIIDGSASQSVIQVTANNVNITGFTLQNTKSGYGGIHLYYSVGNNISNNLIKNTYYGIYLYVSHNNTILGNDASNNLYAGIYLYFSSDNTISGNSASENDYAGIFLFSSANNFLSSNNATDNDYGIRLSDSTDNFLSGNNASTNDYGIHIEDSRNNFLSGNTLSSNNLNGIRLDSSTNNTLLGNNASSNKHAGIYIHLSSDNFLLGNNVSDNDYGIHLSDSNTSTLTGNEALNNDYGIALFSSSNNTFSDNNALTNQHGVHFDHSSNNTIFHNSFINNTEPLSSLNSINSLDNGIEGNYWTNYIGTDVNQDAIGDTPYILAENHTDNYPLMGSFSSFKILLEGEIYHVPTICNSTISEFQFDDAEKIINFNLTGPNDTLGFFRVTIPKILISGPYLILFDGEEVNATTLPISNTTHAFLYFTYILSTHEVTIASKPYYELLEKYNNLLADYHNLNSTYHELLNVYTILLANYTQLQDNYNIINTTYYEILGNFTELQKDYDSLQTSYNSLDSTYNTLNSTYNNLLALYNELESRHHETTNELINIRNLMNVFIAATIVGTLAAVILLSLNIKYYRMFSEQKRFIQAYSPLEIASALFRADIERRGEKIRGFEKKYGVQIRPRDTLEEIIRGLERKKKVKG